MEYLLRDSPQKEISCMKIVEIVFLKLMDFLKCYINYIDCLL